MIILVLKFNKGNKRKPTHYPADYKYILVNLNILSKERIYNISNSIPNNILLKLFLIIKLYNCRVCCEEI